MEGKLTVQFRAYNVLAWLKQLGLLCSYKITAKNGDETIAEANFKVSERVLPRFEVKMEEPTELIANSTEKEVKVCAIYTHGGKVKGKAAVVFETEAKPQYWR